MTKIGLSQNIFANIRQFQAKVRIDEIRKNEYKYKNEFGSKWSDRWVSPHKAWKLKYSTLRP